MSWTPGYAAPPVQSWVFSFMQLRCSGADAGADSTTQRPSVVQSLCDKCIHLKDVKSWHWKLRQNRTLSPVCCRGICRGAKPGLFATRSHSPKKAPKSKDQTQSIWVSKDAKNIKIFKLHFGTTNFGAFYPSNLRSILHHRSKNRHLKVGSIVLSICRFTPPHITGWGSHDPSGQHWFFSHRSFLRVQNMDVEMWKCHFFGELVFTMFIMASRYLNDFEKPQSPTYVYGYEFIFLLWMIFKLSSNFVPDVPGQNTGLPTGHGPAFQVWSHSVINRIRLNKDNNKTRVQILKTNFPPRSENQSSLDIGYGLFSGRLLDCLMRQYSARSKIRGLDGELMQKCSYYRIETRQSLPSSTLDCGHQCPWHLHLRFGVWLRRFLQAKMANQHKCRNIWV